jgi:hypothetical protein
MKHLYSLACRVLSIPSICCGIILLIYSGLGLIVPRVFDGLSGFEVLTATVIGLLLLTAGRGTWKRHILWITTNSITWLALAAIRMSFVCNGQPFLVSDLVVAIIATASLILLLASLMRRITKRGASS